jgi:Ricin-type beta-trefoil lectin domain
MRAKSLRILTLTVAVVCAMWSIPSGQKAEAFTSSAKMCSGGRFADLAAWELLDMYYGGAPDYDYCVIDGLFQARNGYLPIFAFETNVANDVGLVAVRPNGDCSPPAAATGWAWDFELPCSAHDLCYDARKAGFSATISDDACDWEFYQLMLAHCNNRVLDYDCRLVAGWYYNGVQLPGVVTDPDPYPVTLRPTHSPSKCAEVPGSAWGFQVPLTQYTCFFTANQKFIFKPTADAGVFEMRPSHYPSNCAAVSGSSIVQWGCGGLGTSLWTIWGYGNQNLYTIRSKSSQGSKCWDVPGSSQSNGIGLVEYSCYATPNQRWYIG